MDRNKMLVIAREGDVLAQGELYDEALESNDGKFIVNVIRSRPTSDRMDKMQRLLYKLKHLHEYTSYHHYQEIFNTYGDHTEDYFHAMMIVTENSDYPGDHLEWAQSVDLSAVSDEEMIEYIRLEDNSYLIE